MKLLVMKSLCRSVAFSLMCGNVFLRHMKSDTIHLFSTDKVRNEVLHVADRVKKTIVFASTFQSQ